MKRRSFLASGSAALVASQSFFSPQRVLGANDRIHIAVIGCGGRGNYLQNTIGELMDECNAEVTAVCDVSKRTVERVAGSVQKRTGREPKQSQRYGDIISLKDIDAVMIATPDFAHSRILAEAAWEGKHIYCEKPMSHTMSEANAAVDAVEKNKVICQVGTQRRSHQPHHEAAKMIRAGLLGQVTEIECQYNRCTPSWLRSYSDVRQDDIDWEQFLMYLPKREFDPLRYRCWHLFRDYTIGLAGLLGVHVVDVGPWFMDDPFPATACGTGGTLIWEEHREHYDTMEASFMFPKGFIVRFTSRLGNSAGGTEVQIRGTKGTFDTGTLTATGEGGGKEALKEAVKIEIPAGTPHWSDAKPHMKNWLECIRSGKQPNSDVHAGYSHSVASIMVHQSIDQGRQLKFDPRRREII